MCTLRGTEKDTTSTSSRLSLSSRATSHVDVSTTDCKTGRIGRLDNTLANQTHLQPLQVAARPAAAGDGRAAADVLVKGAHQRDHRDVGLA